MYVSLCVVVVLLFVVGDVVRVCVLCVVVVLLLCFVVVVLLTWRVCVLYLLMLFLL